MEKHDDPYVINYLRTIMAYLQQLEGMLTLILKEVQINNSERKDTK